MNDQPSLWDEAPTVVVPESAERYTERVTRNAVNTAGRHADPQWWDAAMDIVHVLAEERDTFTADDVAERLARRSVSTHDKRALGAVLRVASRKGGVIASTGEWTKSRRPETHGRPVMIWRSLI